MAFNRMKKELKKDILPLLHLRLQLSKKSTKNLLKATLVKMRRQSKRNKNWRHRTTNKRIEL